MHEIASLIDTVRFGLSYDDRKELADAFTAERAAEPEPQVPEIRVAVPGAMSASVGISMGWDTTLGTLTLAIGFASSSSSSVSHPSRLRSAIHCERSVAGDRPRSRFSANHASNSRRPGSSSSRSFARSYLSHSSATYR